MALHESELSESEDVISLRLLNSMFPQGQLSLKWLATPSPELDAWLDAKEAAPGNRLIRELRDYWLVRLLRTAKREHSPEAYRELLQELLVKLRAEPPDGVFRPMRRSQGAPRKESTKQVYRIWLENGRPDWGRLAHAVHGAAYTRADSKLRKTLRDRCRRAVQRCQTIVGDGKVLN
jgi:hypothetical protein